MGMYSFASIANVRDGACVLNLSSRTIYNIFQSPPAAGRHEQIDTPLPTFKAIKEINFVLPLRLPFQKNHTFTGREEELSEIDRCFTESGDSGDAPKVCALVGTGGMGKTQIALRYAYQQSQRFTAIFWVLGSTEGAVRTSFVEAMQRIVDEQARVSWPESAPDYKALGIKLGIPGLIESDGTIISDSETSDNIQTAFFRWLQHLGNRKWLLIFDNVDDLETFSIQDYFPNHGGGAILVTSRRPEFSHFAEQVDLDGLDKENAVKLLLRLAKSPDTTGAAMVVEKLGYMPLAISHAGYFMYEARISAEKYLEYYETAFVTVQSKKPKLGWNYRNDTAATAWELSFSEIRKQDEAAASLLLTCSYLHFHEISESWFENMWDSNNEVTTTDVRGLSGLNNKSRISLLASYSLIKRSYSGTFSVHPVVHTWARERLSDVDRLQVIGDAVGVIGKTIDREELSPSSSKWKGREERTRRVIRHIEHLNQYLKPQFTEFLEREEHGPRFKLTLHNVNEIAIILRDRGNFDEAMRWYQYALTAHEKALGEDRLDILVLINNIASVFDDQFKYDEAIEWYKRVLTGQEDLLGEDHPETLTTVQNIALVLHHKGELDEAMQWAERVLVGREKVLGKEHRDTLDSVVDVAFILHTQGEAKYDEAIQWYMRGLAGGEKALGQGHPTNFYVGHQVADIFYRQGKYDEAIEWFEWTLAGREEALGNDHPDTLTTASELAKAISKRDEEDKITQPPTLIDDEKALGRDDPDPVEYVAPVLNRRDTIRKSEPWYRRAFSRFHKSSG
ncbi:hypothetical protein TWF281_004518 [Arthrobotrys megalospora]